MVAGISRFLSKVYRLTTKFSDVARSRESASAAKDQALLRKLHQTFAKITQDFDGRWHFNTSISSIMILVNEITANEAAMDAGEISPRAIREVFSWVGTVAGTVCSVLCGGDVGANLAARAWWFRTAWPVVNEELAREDEIEIPVQGEWQAGECGEGAGRQR